MIRWNNDYNHGAHPSVLEAFTKYNDESYGGYGLDPWCEKAGEIISSHLGNTSGDIHFLIGGTQVNFVVIKAALRSYQSVICPDSGHINVHETGAVENTGHKIQTAPHSDGIITADQIRDIAGEYRDSDVKEHITKPGLVFISFPTEYGTVYSKKELMDIRRVCDEYGLYLHVDGARMAYGLAAQGNDVTLADIAEVADVFYIGGTKCGAMFGEAVVINHPDIKTHFRSFMKQNGAMLAKGWTIGLQFYTLFCDDTYLEIGRQAVKMAIDIKDAFVKKGIDLYCDSNTNQQFVILDERQMAQISKNHIFEYIARMDEDRHCVRFCTSWSTRSADVDVLVRDIFAL